MTPAEELTAAADRLDAAADVTFDGPWRFRLWNGRFQVVDGDNEVVVKGDGDLNLDYIATMHPGVGKALAGWLHSHSDWAAEHQNHGLDCSYFDPDTDFGLAVARAINSRTTAP